MRIAELLKLYHVKRSGLFVGKFQPNPRFSLPLLNILLLPMLLEYILGIFFV